MGWRGGLGERESTRSTAGPKRRTQADSQLGNASKADLKTHCKQSSHSCSVTYRSIEVITCLPGTYGYICETSRGSMWWNSTPDHKLQWQNEKYLCSFSHLKKIKPTLSLKFKTYIFSPLNSHQLLKQILKNWPYLMLHFWSVSLYDYLTMFIFQENVPSCSMKIIDVTILKHKTIALFVSRHTLIKTNVRK